jgi:hypothetical protein
LDRQANELALSVPVESPAKTLGADGKLAASSGILMLNLGIEENDLVRNCYGPSLGCAYTAALDRAPLAPHDLDN